MAADMTLLIKANLLLIKDLNGLNIYRPPALIVLDY